MHALTPDQIAMAEALPDMIWTATPAGVVDYANRAFTRYTGIEAATVSQGSWLDAVHPDDRARTVAIWQQCVAQAQPYHIEFRFLHQPSQTYRWHHVVAKPHHDANGAVERWYGISTDIHDTKLAQDAVSEANRNVRRLLALQGLEARVLDMVSAEHELPLILDQITRTVDTLLPGVASSVLLVHDGRLLHGAAPGLPEAYCRAVHGLRIAEGMGSCGTAAARRRPVIVVELDRDPLWAHRPDLVELSGMRACWSTPVLNAADDVIATFGMYYAQPRSPTADDQAFIERICQFVRVAIERTRQREALRASEARFRAVAQATSDVIWEYDVTTDRLWHSEGMARIFGHDPATDPVLATGFRAAQYIHPEDRDATMAAIRDAVKNRRGWRLEYRYQRADGSHAHVLCRAIVAPSQAGKPPYFIGSLSDVTEQKGLEEQLRRAQRLEAVGQLTGGLAHDFNNLLTVILGNADQLADELPLGSEHQHLARDIRVAASKGSHLIRSLLAFARQQVLMAKPTDVNHLVGNLLPLLERTLGGHLGLVLELDPGCWPILVDPGQLESAVLNLAINARDAMGDGGQIVIRTGKRLSQGENLIDSRLPPGSYVLVEVEDSGHGMTPETLRHVFEPFFTTKEVGKGNGLGLSMVYGFVKQSNGYIHLVSAPGRGTRVQLYFPRHHQATLAPPEPQARAALPRGTEKLLVVEDDPVVQQFLRVQLSQLGYGFCLASNGPEALALLADNPDIQLLLTDVAMPGGMDGYEVAARARAQRPRLPVIVSSGYSEELNPSKERTAEGYWVLGKPYLRAKLATRLRQALETAGT